MSDIVDQDDEKDCVGTDYKVRSTSADDPAARFVREALPLVEDLYRAARRHTRITADAEDLVQETMLRAYAAYDSFRPGTNLKGWLFRIQTNTWISNHRARSRRPEESLIDVFTDSQLMNGAQHETALLKSAETQALANVPDDDVHSALQQLTEPQRIVVYLADIEGFRHKEISEITGMPLGTVMSRLHRGRNALRQALATVAAARGYLQAEKSRPDQLR